MGRLGLLFLVVSIMASLLGFGWVADLAYPAARFVCFVFLALAAVSFFIEILEGGAFQEASWRRRPYS
jgi:uncharacterized membrane protein YtjA (UPF0391 family)